MKYEAPMSWSRFIAAIIVISLFNNKTNLNIESNGMQSSEIMSKHCILYFDSQKFEFMQHKSYLLAKIYDILPVTKSFLANALNSFRRIYPTEVVPLSKCSNR